MLKKIVSFALLFLSAAAGAAQLKLADGWVVNYGSSNFEVQAADNGVGVYLKCLKPGRYLEISKTVTLPLKTRFNFSANIESDAQGKVQLLATTQESKTKKKYYWWSNFNLEKSDYLLCEGDVQYNEKMTFICRVFADTKDMELKITDIKCVEPSGDGNVNLEITPGYASAAYELSNLAAGKAEEFSASIRYREKGGKFLDAYKADFPPLEHKARGVVVNLKEDTSYELEITLDDNGNKQVIKREFKTLGKALPIAKTVTVTPQMIKNGLKITQSGTADGYIRYTSKPGVVLESSGKNAITLNAVNYIIIDGLTIRGGNENGICVTGCRNIVIRNCDISKFGRVGTLKTHLGGEYYARSASGKEFILNNDAGIWIRAVKNMLIENNFIHDSRGFTNGWFYSHPTGPKAINVGLAANVTMRYNDFIASDRHRWNDAVECMGNGSETGGLYRNAEIYGNLFALCNDDGIELEGGEINTRFFGNRVESTLCGVSSGSCTRGPSYIFNNLFWRNGDANGNGVAAFKNGHGSWGSGKVHIFNNTAHGFGTGIHPPGNGPIKTRLDKMEFFNNIFSVAVVGGDKNLFTVAKSVSDYNLHDTTAGLSLEKYRSTYNQENNSISADPKYKSPADGDMSLKSDSPAVGSGKTLANFTSPDKPADMGAFSSDNPRPLPLRDLPFVTSVQVLDFKYGDTAPRTVTVTATEDGVKIPFVIAKTNEAPYLEVTPSKGVIESGKPLELKVRIVPEKFHTARINNTVFLIRTPNGAARPVTVSADSSKCRKLLDAERKNVLFADVTNSKKSTEFEVDVKKDGYYFVMLYGKPGTGSATVYVDGKKLYTGKIRFTYRVRGKVINQKAYFNIPQKKGKNRPIKLNAGNHKFKIVFTSGYKPEKAALMNNDAELLPAAWVL